MERRAWLATQEEKAAAELEASKKGNDKKEKRSKDGL